MTSNATTPRLIAGQSLLTLEAHMLAEEANHPDSQGTLPWVVSAIGLAAKSIAGKLRHAYLEDVLGAHGAENVQGEDQQKLDVIADDFMIAALSMHDGVAVLGSEEDEHLIYTGNAANGRPQYAVFFDPLDGSSNLDTAGGVGTIFSIYRVTEDGDYKLRPGREQVVAGYVLYGSSSVFVLSAGSGVHMFVLDTGVGAFIRVIQNLRVPKKGSVYSVNEANVDSFPEGFKNYIADCHTNGYSARYAGAMVADVHRLLLKGGVFLYPPTAKAPNGKLRLMYECNPMAKLVIDAGGKATTGQMDILDVEPQALHQRVPVLLGSPDDVDVALKLTQG
jgi:fructose-1,6-bisphosphatase I